MKWKRNIVHENEVAKVYARNGMPTDSVPKVFYGYEGDEEVLHALLSREEWVPGDTRWHISIAGQGRVPTWSEVAEACHSLRPGVPFVMGVPPRSQWMNVHDDVLHAWETRDANMLAQWKANARGDRPT